MSYDEPATSPPITADVTATPPTEAAVPRSVAALDAVVAGAELAAVVIGLDGTLVSSNALGSQLFKLEASPDANQLGRLRIVLDQLPQQLITGPEGGTWTGEVSFGNLLGRPTSHEVTVHVHHDATAADGGYVALLARDVTDERDRLTDLVHRLERDPTTGLLNRTAAINHLIELLDAGIDRTLAVLMVDVDRLADVNDALGHDVGDRLLASTARRLSTAVRPDDVVARMGGDEFLVVCVDVEDAPTAMDLADRIRKALTGRLTIHQLELDVSVSVGVSILEPASANADAPDAQADEADEAEPTDEPIDPTSDAPPVAGATSPRHAAVQLVSEADTAVHAAKHAGRARTARFTPQLASQARVRTELSAALSRALREGQLRVEYQPIFSAVSELAEAAEALVRWQHPTRGRIEAGEFIPIAEQTGIIVPIGDWVLQHACATARSWIDDGVVGARFAVHVNVSRLQLASPSFVNRVVDLLREYRLRPRQVVLEVREASLVDSDASEVVRSIRALRRVGVRVAIDNFGTGSHALSLMTDIGADVLKLDGSLALPNGASETDTRVVRALVLLAHSLNMEVVAERVSGLEQLRRLRAAGCDLVQGHLVGSPAPPDELVVQMEL